MSKNAYENFVPPAFRVVDHYGEAVGWDTHISRVETPWVRSDDMDQSEGQEKQSTEAQLQQARAEAELWVDRVHKLHPPKMTIGGKEILCPIELSSENLEP